MRTELTAKQRRAAILVAEDEMPDREIAESVGTHVATLERWKQIPAFTETVRSHIAELATHLERYSIARKDRRMAAYQRRWDAYQAIIAARAEAMAGAAAGAETGLISQEFELDRDGIEHPLFKVDTSTSAEMRALEKQAAMEAGQWAEKHEHTGDVTIRQYVGISPDDA